MYTPLLNFWDSKKGIRKSKIRRSRLLQSKDCIPCRRCRLRWHKWGKCGGYSCSLITVTETHPFCQGLQNLLWCNCLPYCRISRRQSKGRKQEYNKAEAHLVFMLHVWNSIKVQIRIFYSLSESITSYVGWVWVSGRNCDTMCSW